MITTQNETIARPAQDRLHAATIGFNARGARIVKASSMNRTPEVRVELEISAAPLAPHRAKKRLEMLLDLWVFRAVLERSSEGQRLAPQRGCPAGDPAPSAHQAAEPRNQLPLSCLSLAKQSYAL